MAASLLLHHCIVCFTTALRRYSDGAIGREIHGQACPTVSLGRSLYYCIHCMICNRVLEGQILAVARVDRVKTGNCKATKPTAGLTVCYDIHAESQGLST